MLTNCERLWMACRIHALSKEATERLDADDDLGLDAE